MLPYWFSLGHIGLVHVEKRWRKGGDCLGEMDIPGYAERQLILCFLLPREKWLVAVHVMRAGWPIPFKQEVFSPCNCNSSLVNTLVTLT